MADLNQTLFRIDPTEGLLQYVQAVKPFHSKVLDVFVEYIYSEPLSVNMTDRKHLEVGLQNFVQPVVYSCGFGFVWNPYNSALPGQLASASIISAQGPVSLDASVSGTIVTLVPDLGGFTFSVNQPVTFRTTGTFPAELSQGGTYYVNVVGVNQITVRSTLLAGPSISFSGPGTGQLSVVPQDLKYNSFLVSMPVATQYQTVVSGLITNQMTLATAFNVITVTPATKQWVVSGDLVPLVGDPVVVIGNKVYISGNTDPSANREYTVASVTTNLAHTESTVTVVESVSLIATNTGRLNAPIDAQYIPYWPAGMAVKIASTSSFPVPITGSTVYYFNPTPIVGIFNLSKVRYPQKFDDIVDLSTLGDGQLTIFRVEPFVPGELVTLTGSYLGENDDQYAINTIVAEGPNFRLTVWQHVDQTTPLSIASVSTGLSTVGSIVPGTLYTPLSGAAVRYTAVPLTTLSGTGSGATAEIAVVDGAVATVDITNRGTNYTLGTVVSASAANLGGTGSGFSATVSAIGDGRMVYSGGYGDPFCAVASAPALYTAGFFHERIQFVFGPSPVSAYLLDTFIGLGDLSTHTVDSGHTWSILQFGDSLSELMLSGEGTLSSNDTDIWVRSNWTPPAATTFSVEVDLFVGGAPPSGKPRFTLFAKETSLVTFNGPFVDIIPDLATGKIIVTLGSTSGGVTTTPLYTMPMTINTESSLIVKLERLNSNQARLYVNGTLLFTSGTIFWPTLTYVGFNINTPLGDPTQFALKRIQAIDG